MHNPPKKKPEKLKITKEEYVTLVSDGLRMVHHIMPKKVNSYIQWKASLNNLQSAIEARSPIKKRVNSPRIASARNSVHRSTPSTSMAFSSRRGSEKNEKVKTIVIYFLELDGKSNRMHGKA